jgi:hypothetical protein
MTWKCGVPYTIPPHPCPSGIRCEWPTAKSKGDCARPPCCLIEETTFRANLVEVSTKPCLGWACDHYQVAGEGGGLRTCDLDLCPPRLGQKMFCRHPEARP